MISSGIPKISELPVSQDFISGDKLIVERDNSLYLVDYDNILIYSDQISFNDEILKDINQVNNLNAFSQEKYNELVEGLTEKSINRSSTHLIDITSVTTQGTLSSPNYKEFIVSSIKPFSGPNNLITFDRSVVDKLNISTDEVTSTENLECDVGEIVFGQGTISIPKGTYRVRASISLSPEINLDLSQNTLDEYIKQKQRIWAYLSFVQLTPPSRVILNGSGGLTYNTVGKSITLNLNGFIYTDKTKQYALMVHTLGKFYPGVVAGTYSQDNNNNSLDINYTSVSNLFQREQYNQSRILIERISDTNTLNPLEDSSPSTRSQSLILPTRIPLIYNAGWLQKIDAQDIDIVPSTLKTTISSLPFSYRPDIENYIGDLRGYITEPKSHQGYIKVGDNVRFRSQQPSPSTGEVDIGFARYDIRDPVLRTLQPGWYGLIIDLQKTVGQQYDTVFRVDKNGVVSQREYITDPTTYYTKCIIGQNTTLSPATTTTPRPGTTTPGPGTTTSTSTTQRPRTRVNPGFTQAVAQTKTFIIPSTFPPNTPIHILCIGAGGGGIKSNIRSNGGYGQAGDGGDLRYKNYINVSPGDRITLTGGAPGQGINFTRNIPANSPRRGKNSSVRVEFVGTGTKRAPDVVVTAAGGNSVSSSSRGQGIGGGNGGFGGNVDLIRFNGALIEFPGGGGGAGGYTGNGGNGATGLGDADGKAGAGGGGGGGSIGSSGPPLRRAGRGGGTGDDGTGRPGVGGRYTGSDDSQAKRNGKRGGKGTAEAGEYGWGGPGLSFNIENPDQGDGGKGVAKIIWGDGVSWPKGI